MPAEPAAIALLLTTFGVLLVASTLFSRASQRAGVPVALIFLLVGMVAGSEGLGGIVFEDYRFAFRLGTVALVLILFDGGLNTPMSAVRQSGRPAALLATVGVAATGLLIAAAANALGVAWPAALLLGAIVSSTDAAAVFSVLRASGLHLKRRVGATLEVESGINDPVAVILTVFLTRALLYPAESATAALPVELVAEIVVGAAFGLGIGYGGRFALARVRLPASGLYPAFMLALAFLAYGLPTLAHGSGFLAVYLAGVVLGNGELPVRASILRVNDALAWLAQIGMFLVLGLLVFPSRLAAVAGIGFVLALFLAFVARPAAVALCLAPFHAYTRKDVAFVGWVGLRGAVPIVLATYPVLAGAPGADRVFDIVFFIVVVSVLVPGATVPWVTRRLGLQSDDPPPPPAVLEIESTRPLHGQLLSFYVDEALPVVGTALADIPFPAGSAVTLVIRGNQLVAPRGHTVLEPGDHVYVLSSPEDFEFVRLLFGRPEGD